MQSLTEKVFKLAPPGGLFDETVIDNLFPDNSAGARALLVHRACQAGEILRLKPDSIGMILALDLPCERFRVRKIRIKLEIDINPPA